MFCAIRKFVLYCFAAGVFAGAAFIGLQADSMQGIDFGIALVMAMAGCALMVAAGDIGRARPYQSAISAGFKNLPAVFLCVLVIGVAGLALIFVQPTNQSRGETWMLLRAGSLIISVTILAIMFPIPAPKPPESPTCRIAPPRHGDHYIMRPESGQPRQHRGTRRRRVSGRISRG